MNLSKKDNENNREHKEGRAKMERKTLNIENFSQYSDNCNQVWFRMGLDDSKFL